MKSIIVSVHCAVYNHAPYLRQCLNGIVMQKTKFNYEIIVHDDVSTDGSVEIIQEYIYKYPDLIKPIFEAENQYSKHDGSVRRIMREASKGKYIAICEGDDYWSDPLKLQKQVDILENDASIGLVYSDFDLVDFNSNMLDDTSAPKRICNIKQNFRHGYIYDQLFNHSSNILSCTVLYRKNLITTEPIIDHDLFMQISKVSKISFIDEKLAVYRINPKGMMLSDSERVSSYLFRTISNHMIDFYIQKNYIYNVDIKKLKKEVEIFFSKYVTSYIRGNKEASSNIILKIIKIDPLLLIKTPLNILRRLGNNR